MDNQQIKKVEILAPAGSIEAFYGCILAGADAVYLAGNRYGARAYADNFSTEELISCIRYAKLLHRKIYLTVNTLIKESEMENVIPFIRPFYEEGLDGVIIQDLGLVQQLKYHFPGMELHASTQMTITGSEGAALMAEEGICRVVPARELSLEEIKKIKKDTGLEIECFIHGAMCYCYSGQCLFSSFLGGRSGNRGRCAQPCRLNYEFGQKQGYPLSMKDMCTAPILQELIESGIDSFKIEGRMKRPEYAAGVTSIYRKLVDSYYETGTCTLSKEDEALLHRLYVRSEISEGYYHKHNGRELITKNSPAYATTEDQLLTMIHDQYIKDAINRFPKLSVQMYASFLLSEPASLTVTLDDNPEVYVTVTGEEVMEAKNRPLLEEDIKKGLLKLGNSYFSCTEDDCQVFSSENIFYSLKSINELRRLAIDKLTDILLKQGRRTSKNPQNIDTVTQMSDNKKVEDSDDSALRVLVRSLPQLEAVASSKTELANNGLLASASDHIRIYLEEDLLLSDTEKVLSICKEMPKNNSNDSMGLTVAFYIAMVPVRRYRDKKLIIRLEKILSEQHLFEGLLIRNLEDFAYWKRHNKNSDLDFRLVADASLYSWNRSAQKYLAKTFDELVLPLEPSGYETKQLAKVYQENYGKKIEKLVYGRNVMMVSAGCIRKTCLSCENGSGSEFLYLKDRKSAQLPVRVDCLHCQNVIFNSEKISLHRVLEDYKDFCSFRLEFTDESFEETKHILVYYYRLKNDQYHFDKSNPDPVKSYTTGHEKNGVE